MLMGSLMMEEKQLDFNRPLISVRRPTQASETESKIRSSDLATKKKIPPPSSPPVYKSDIKSGPVRNPGTVPFQWEYQPGKPKDESKPDSNCFVEPPHFVPKLPPGRKELGRKLEIRGKDLKEDVKSSSPTSRYDDGDSESAYLDAMNTLSRSESFFYNCSNVSGVDGPGVLVEPFGILSSDRQMQDLMMGRFLPAAKALTSETPLHNPRKPPKPEESSRQMMKKVKQRAVSVRRMRSKYQDSSIKQNNDTVKEEDKKKLKISESVAQEPLVSVSCTPPCAKTSKNFGELLASDDNTWEEPVAEKTLYVDTVHSVDKKVQEETKEQSLKAYPSLDDVPVKDGAIKEEQMNVKRDEDCIEFTSRKVEECPDQAIVTLPGSNIVEVTKEKIKTNHERSSYHSAPPPPLPKAPSDSWLKRTLPIIPSKNNSFIWLQSHGIDSTTHFTKTHTNPKWETMVKTSNTQQGFVCFSKEALNTIPEA